MTELNIAEIPYEDSAIRYRYARYMSKDGTRWIRHGLFLSYYPNGVLSSEGTYADGEEQGLWTVYHPNGKMAARGRYENGKEVGPWEFWDDDGSPSAE